MRLQVHWKLNLPPFGTQLVLTNFCYILNSCHFFKDCTCPFPHFTDRVITARKGEYGKNHVLALNCSPGNDICPFCSNCTGLNKSYDQVQSHGVERAREILSLLNQTWVLSLDTWQSQSPDTWLWWRELQHSFQGTKQGERQLVLKRPSPPVALRQGFLKATLGWGLQGMWSAPERFSNWLVVR